MFFAKIESKKSLTSASSIIIGLIFFRLVLVNAVSVWDILKFFGLPVDTH